MKIYEFTLVLIGIFSFSLLLYTTILYKNDKNNLEECIEDNLCIEYYKKYKLFNMHDESYKLYLEFNNKKIN